MTVLKSLLSAFLMYSRIPVPQVEWKEENRRYSLCFFPLVGGVTGAVFLIWKYICTRLSVSAFVFAAVGVLIPIMITGGIHLDGFCDTVDAMSSFGDKEKKIEIMSDPHIGSFAVLRLCAYLILQTALLTEIKNTAVIACGFVLSRTLSGIAAVTFRSAKKDGYLQEFSKPAHKKITVFSLSAAACACIAAMTLTGGAIGVIAVIGAFFGFVYYRYSAYKNFGGITGDTAGWFLQICEIAILIFTAAGEKLSEAFKI
ncbi:MAG: adenosylcobinamide-GDP ribazoletransferase [Ruminococcus sp.]|nr:adenosylcobinamide-GDP ribazoletransferase [Ruminococcus sp.]